VPEELRNLVRQKDKKILFVGIGNILKSDDGAGVYISSRIKESDTISALTVEVSLENYIGKINALNPEILVLIDCLDMNSPPGTYKLLPVDSIKDMTFNTHNISIKRISDFFKMPVWILGIQPEKIYFGENISYLVRHEADKIIDIINTN
jgi:hydrogenase 3 maturation protease